MRRECVAILIASCATLTCKGRESTFSETASAETEEAPGCESIDATGAISTLALRKKAQNPACKAKFLELPLVRQTKGFTCGAASLQSVLFYFGDFFPEGVLQRILKSHKENGTSFRRIMKLVQNLNVASSREAFDEVSGFDEAMELSDLRRVLSNPEVKALIKSKANGKQEFASVLAGLEQLKKEDVDLDKLEGAPAASGSGLSLTADDTEEVGTVRTQRNDPAQLPSGAYSIELFVDQTLFSGGEGAGTEGCPTNPPPTASSSHPLQKRGMTIAQLEKAIDSGSPVIALTQAWTFTSDSDYDISEYERAWYSGHYIVVVGYDPRNIYFMDPYNMGHYAFLPREEWLKRWHDYDGFLSKDYKKCKGGHELRNFGLVVSRIGGAKYPRDAITKMY